MKKSIVMAVLGILLLPLPVSTAYAAGECVVTPRKVETVRHAATEHREYRWKKSIPATQEESHIEYRYVRTNPGSEAVTHTEYQFKRTNPGQEETFHKEFKYKKVIPAVDGVKECEYQKKVTDFKTEYQWEKWVKGTKEKKVNGRWINDGTFDYRDWPGAGPVWSDGGSGSHHDTWIEGDTRYTSTYFKYVKTGVERQVPDGYHWEYQWATSDPGEGWSRTNKPCRWKVDPVPEQTVPYNDGNWTTDILGDPWVEIDQQSVSNGDAIAPFTEYKTESGVSTVESDAALFTEDSFPDWVQFNSKTVTDKEAVPPFDEWATKSGQTTNVNEADYFTEAEAATLDPDWSKYGEPLKVVDQEYVPEYLVFYVEDGEPTRELGDTNWTKGNPGKPWLPVDERTVVDAKAYTTSKVVPAVYGPCKLAETGSNETAVLVVVALGLLALGGTLVVLKNRLT